MAKRRATPTPAGEAIWDYLETQMGSIFGRIFDLKLITLREFEKLNYYSGSFAEEFDWIAYADYKATVLMLLLAELGEL